MNDSVFGQVDFHYGWNKQDSIMLWGNNFEVRVTAAAYYEHEPITENQKKAYNFFTTNKLEISKKIEQLLSDVVSDPQKHLTPRFLVFEKNGAYALMLDNDTDPDDGIAVQLSPEEKVMSQDAYL